MIRSGVHVSHILDSEVTTNTNAIVNHSPAKFKPIVLVSNDNVDEITPYRNNQNITSIMKEANQDVIVDLNDEEENDKGKENYPTYPQGYSNMNVVKENEEQPNEPKEQPNEIKYHIINDILNKEKFDYLEEWVTKFQLPFFLTKEYVNQNFDIIASFER